MPFLFPNNLLSEGMRSAVSCQVLAGNLPLTFAWDRNGAAIDNYNSNGNDEDVTVRSGDEYSSTLVIERLDFRHRGNYTCTVSNPAGSSSHTAELTVKVPPKWTREPQDVRAVEGQDVLLPCLVEGFPAPSTLWTKESGGFGQPALSLSSSQFKNGSLLLSDVSKQSEGQYTCTAENGVRASLSKTVNVTVNGERIRDVAKS